MKKKRVWILLLLCLLFPGGCGSVSPRCGSESTGPFTEFCLNTQSVVVSITAGPDGALWFTDQLGKIGRITVGGKISELALPDPNYGPEEITAGPDGALWFTERIISRGKPDQSEIGRITVGGKISEFPLPGLFRLDGFTAGPDGALWFTGNPAK